MRRRSLIVTEIESSFRLTKSEIALSQLPIRIQGIGYLMREGVVPLINKLIIRHWESEGRAFGHTWAPLAPTTIERKFRKGTLSRGILHDTEHLFKALFRERTADNRLSAIPGGYRIALNTRVRYAVYHQVGTTIMPERQVFPDPLPSAFVREVKSVARLYFRTGSVVGEGVA